MNKLLYKENLDENKLLKSDKRMFYIVYLVLVFFSGAISWLVAIFLIIDSNMVFLIFMIVGTVAWLIGFSFRKMAVRIRPLEVYDDGFIWPYYNWPTDDGFVRWDDVRMILLNVKEFPSSLFISIKGMKWKFIMLKKYAIYDIERFLDMARSRNIVVVEDEIRFRDIGKLRP